MVGKGGWSLALDGLADIGGNSWLVGRTEKEQGGLNTLLLLYGVSRILVNLETGVAVFITPLEFSAAVFQRDAYGMTDEQFCHPAGVFLTGTV
jgi:hypothetical protein